MNKIVKSVVVMMAMCLLIVGICMSHMQVKWQDVKTSVIPSTKGRNALIGGIGGGVLGGITGSLLGGVGIVLCGTGVGIPAGVAMIATGTTVGAGAGAVTGAAFGDGTYTRREVIHRSAPAYPAWQWITVLVGSLAMFAPCLLVKQPSLNR